MASGERKVPHREEDAPADVPVESGQRRIGRVCMLGGLILVAGIGVWVTVLGFYEMPTVADFAGAIRGLGAWGVAGSIGLMVLHSFVPFPAEFLALANGMVYGPLWGTVITWVGAMLGAFIAFALARCLGRPFVAMMVAERHWQHVDRWIAEQGWQMLLVARFLPVIAFNLINYGAGLTRIPWWTFAWTTGLGILPVTTLMVVMGDRIHEMHWSLWLALLALCLLMLVGIGHYYRRRFDAT